MSTKNIYLVIIILIISSCNNYQEIKKNTLINLNSLNEAVDNYNVVRNENQHIGVIIEGNIDINHLENDNGDLVVEFLISNKSTFRKFDFQYDKSNGQVLLPKEIINGQITYLGDQIIIQDLNKQESFLLKVETSQKRISNIPTLNGIGIISQVFDDQVALASAAGTCSCSCTSCFGCVFCNPKSASCNCDGNGQSVTCRDCYTAGCTECSDE